MTSTLLRVFSSGQVFLASEMVVVKMGDDGIVDLRLLIPGIDLPDITCDPFVRSMGGIGAEGCITRAGGPGIGGVQLSRVEEYRRAVRQDVEGGVAPAGIDMVQVQVAFLPGGKWFADFGDGLSSGGGLRFAGKTGEEEQEDADSFHLGEISYYPPISCRRPGRSNRWVNMVRFPCASFGHWSRGRSQ